MHKIKLCSSFKVTELSKCETQFEQSLFIKRTKTIKILKDFLLNFTEKPFSDFVSLILHTDVFLIRIVFIRTFRNIIRTIPYVRVA